MARLIYSSIVSLDGYSCDDDDRFDWAEPDDEVHTFVNDLERPIATYLYGRRMYDVMSSWETIADTELAEVARDYARIWRAADKVVYSTTLPAAVTARTRIERHFDPDAIRHLKAESERDLSIGGSTLAASAVRAGLVDEFHLFVNPVVVGGGTRALPDGVRCTLELVDEHRFGSGVVHLHYRDRG